MITSSELFPSRESTLKANLETYVAEILKTKEKKFVRDKLSYGNNVAYNWAQTKNRTRNNKMRNTKESTNELNDSVSSASSSQAQDHSRTFRTLSSFKHSKSPQIIWYHETRSRHKITHEHVGHYSQNLLFIG